MKVVSTVKLKPYSAPEHFNFSELKLHGKEETDLKNYG